MQSGSRFFSHQKGQCTIVAVKGTIGMVQNCFEFNLVTSSKLAPVDRERAQEGSGGCCSICT